MEYTDIIVQKKGAVVWLTINKPQVRNAMGRRTLTEMVAALEDASSNPAVKVLVFRGAGNTFCSGMDTKEGISPGGPGSEEFTQLADRFFHSVKKFPKITISVVNGYCLAGGLELALGCDFVIADEECKIGDGHINLPGWVPNAGASVYLPRLVGMQKAKELLLTGNFISGSEAERIGLVNRAVPAAQLEGIVEELTANLAGKSALGLRYMKMLIEKGMECSTETALSLERTALKMIINTEDYREAVAAMKKARDSRHKK